MPDVKESPLDPDEEAGQGWNDGGYGISDSAGRGEIYMETQKKPKAVCIGRERHTRRAHTGISSSPWASVAPNYVTLFIRRRALLSGPPRAGAHVFPFYFPFFSPLFIFSFSLPFFFCRVLSFLPSDSLSGRRAAVKRCARARAPRVLYLHDVYVCPPRARVINDLEDGRGGPAGVFFPIYA